MTGTGLDITCLNPNRQWGKVTNIVYNSYLYTALPKLTRPFRKPFERLKARGETS